MRRQRAPPLSPPPKRRDQGGVGDDVGGAAGSVHGGKRVGGGAPRAAGSASGDQRVERHRVWRHAGGRHLVKHVQCELPPPRALGRGDEGGERDDGGFAPAPRHFAVHVEGTVQPAGPSMRTDQRVVRRCVRSMPLSQQTTVGCDRVAVATARVERQHQRVVRAQHGQHAGGRHGVQHAACAICVARFAEGVDEGVEGDDIGCAPIGAHGCIGPQSQGQPPSFDAHVHEGGVRVHVGRDAVAPHGGCQLEGARDVARGEAGGDGGREDEHVRRSGWRGACPHRHTVQRGNAQSVEDFGGAGGVAGPGQLLEEGCEPSGVLSRRKAEQARRERSRRRRSDGGRQFLSRHLGCRLFLPPWRVVAGGVGGAGSGTSGRGAGVAKRGTPPADGRGGHAGRMLVPGVLPHPGRHQIEPSEGLIQGGVGPGVHGGRVAGTECWRMSRRGGPNASVLGHGTGSATSRRHSGVAPGTMLGTQPMPPGGRGARRGGEGGRRGHARRKPRTTAEEL